MDDLIEIDVGPEYLRKALQKQQASESEAVQVHWGLAHCNVQLFVAACRALSLETRLVSGLSPHPLKISLKAVNLDAKNSE